MTKRKRIFGLASKVRMPPDFDAPEDWIDLTPGNTGLDRKDARGKGERSSMTNRQTGRIQMNSQVATHIYIPDATPREVAVAAKALVDAGLLKIAQVYADEPCVIRVPDVEWLPGVYVELLKAAAKVAIAAYRRSNDATR